MLLISVLQIREELCRDNPKRATEGRSGIPDVITTGLECTESPGSMGSLSSLKC